MTATSNPPIPYNPLPGELQQPTSLGLVPGTDVAGRFVVALRNGRFDEARRIAVEEAPAFELTNFIIEPLIAKLGTLPRHFMAGREASRKLARMLLRDLVDQMFAGDVSTGGHHGPDGRWYVFKGLSPDLVEVSDNVIENVDKAQFLDWIEPLEALLIGHLSGNLSRDAFLSALREPDLVEAATYWHRALQSAATDGAAGTDGASPRRERSSPWDPKKDPDLSVCFAGELGYIVVGSGQSHLIDHAYRDALRVVRQMSQWDLLAIARRVPGEMLQPDYPNLIRNVTAKVSPILGLSPDNRREIREDMEAGGRDHFLMMLALSRARHAGWLSDAVVEEIYALRGKDAAGGGTAPVQVIDSHQELVERLMDRPDDRSFLETLDASEARILLADAVQLLRHERAHPSSSGPVGLMRRGLALLKILSLNGVLDGFMIHPYAGRNLFPAQFGRLAVLNEKTLGPGAKTDRQSFVDEVAREDEVCRRAGLHIRRIEANVVTQRVPGLIGHAAAMARHALTAALREVPDKPITLLFHLREWIQSDAASPVWAQDLDQSYTRMVAPWTAVLRAGDYVVLFETDAAFKPRLLADGNFEEVDLGLAPPVIERAPEPGRVSRRPLGAFDLPSNAVVLRRVAPATSGQELSAPQIR